MISFQKEAPQPFAQEAMDLFNAHFHEIAERTDVIELDPDIEAYERLYAQGKLEIHTIREDDKLIGYSIWFVMNHLHYKKSLTANSDVLFLHPDFRKGITGVKFITWSLNEIKKRKPQRIAFHMKPFLDYSPIIERLGAKYFEKTYTIVME